MGKRAFGWRSSPTIKCEPHQWPGFRDISWLVIVPPLTHGDPTAESDVLVVPTHQFGIILVINIIGLLRDDTRVYQSDAI